MEDVPARHDPNSEADVTYLILRRIAIAPHPLTLADVRWADDGDATLNPLYTAARLDTLCKDGIVESWDDPYPQCIRTKGHCPPQPVYDLTLKGRKLLAEYTAVTQN